MRKETFALFGDIVFGSTTTLTLFIAHILPDSALTLGLSKVAK